MSHRPPSIRPRPDHERQLTGRHVLMMLIGFFGLVFAVNIAMVRAAITTFGGVDTPSSYEAGLQFKAEEARARAQDARDWTVTGHLAPSGDRQVVSVDVRDASGAPVTGIAVAARLMHPIDQRRDVTVVLNQTGPGVFRGSAAVSAGRWRLELVVARNGEQLFRSENRVMVK